MYRSGVLLCIFAIGVRLEAEAATFSNPPEAPYKLEYTCGDNGDITLVSRGNYTSVFATTKDGIPNTCTVDATGLKLTGCGLNKIIMVYLMNLTQNSATNKIVLGGGKVAVYSLACYTANGLNQLQQADVLVADRGSITEDSENPSIIETSLKDLNLEIFKTDSKNEIQIGDDLIVQISFPKSLVQYKTESCIAYDVKIPNPTAQKIVLIPIGGPPGNQLMTSPFESNGKYSKCATNVTGYANKTCLTTVMKAFHFQNSQILTLECEIRFCKTAGGKCNKRKRSSNNKDDADFHKLQATVVVHDFKKEVQLDEPSAASTSGSAQWITAAVLFLAIMNNIA